jgi:hypothetical protein
LLEQMEYVNGQMVHVLHWSNVNRSWIQFIVVHGRINVYGMELYNSVNH